MNELILTGDGSHTLKSNHFDATYHSIHGAIEESNVVFIQAGLNPFIQQKRENICILEVGFGTGLNAYLTYLNTEKSGMQVHYHSLEPYPIDEASFMALNYNEILHADRDVLINLHRAAFDTPTNVGRHFIFTKHKSRLQEIDVNISFDLVYYDAFAPSCQPELWTAEIFGKVHKLMNTNAVLTTYCAKGEVKRNLKSVGFVLESLPGPGRKREITRAIKKD
jgi:tRNA U34 5-methylaminomethyl-2-thiouridine-forming methyltransferase MnmC